ncbi:hyaluronan mediated motility receptor-like [Schistocerca americana]|uniref:hyaluronan mediated motility receptor-like n=1 Tax=Schistocerca americana TaxID=7009 RepID=UPI001F501E06|nr:hyaluronan mediated motility receptor-like [Schistocerca americana]
MSFPRAKRFTEKPSCAPPPGSYDPKFDSKVKGLVIEKSERFTDLKPQVAGAENPNTSIKNCSSSSLPVFRTPQPPRKLRENSQRSRSQTTGLQHAGKKDSATDTEDIDTQSDDGCFNCDGKRRLRFDSMDRSFTSEKIEELSRELKECRSRCLSLEVAISQLEIDKKNLSSIQNEMTEELSKNKLSLQISQDKCCVLNNELELMKETLQAEKIKYQELKNSHDEEYRMLEESHRRLNETFNDLKQGSEKLQRDWESQVLEEKAINSDLSSKVAQKQQMILMLQGELSSLEVEFEDCKAERDKMVSEHNIEKAALLCEYSKNIEKLEKQIEQIESRHSVEKLALEEQLRNLETDCTEYKMAKTSLEAVLSAKEMEVSELIAECEIQKAEYADMKLKHDKDFKILLEQFQNLNDTFSYINRFSEECALKLKEISLKYETLIKHILQLHRNKVKELENYMDLKIEGMKRDSEKTISDLEESVLLLKKEKVDTEDKLALKTEELHRISAALAVLQDEIGQITATRDELRVSNVEQQVTIAELKDKLDSVSVEHNLCKESMATLKCSLEASEDQNRKFEVGNRNLRDSLQALGVRLLESEKDVEQLTATRDQLEAEKEELIAEVAGYKEKLITQEEELQKIEKENLRQIEQIRNELLEKIDTLKCKSVLKTQNMQSMRHDVDSFAGQLSMFTEKLHQVNEYVVQLETASQEQDANIQELQMRLQASEKALLQTQSSLELQAKSYEERISELEDALKRSEAEIDVIAEKLDHHKECAQKQIGQLMQELEENRDFSQKSAQHIVDLTALNADIQACVDNLSVQNMDLKRNVEVSGNEIMDITLQLNCALLKQSQCETELNKLKLERDEITVNLSTLKKCSEEHLKQISNLENIKIIKEKEIEAAESNIVRLQCEVASKDEAIRELKSELDEFKERYSPEKFEAAEKKFLEAENTKSQLMSQIQQLKDEISGSLSELSTNKLLLEEKSQELEKLQLTIQDMQNILNDKQHEIDCLSQEKNDLQQCKILADKELAKAEQEIKFLKLSVKKLEAETKNNIDKCKLAELENTVVELRLKLTTAEDQFNRQLQEYEERALRAERQCCQLEALVGPFRKQLESFLAERGEILRGKDETEDELRNLALKYAHLLGHQNHKQKVKYVVQLQEKNMELREEVEKLRSQARAQKATVDKLKSELTASARKKVGTTTAARQILKNRDNSPGKKPPKGKDGGDVSPARHVPVGKENSPIHTNFVRSKENGSSNMSPVATSTPKAFVDRGNNA